MFVFTDTVNRLQITLQFNKVTCTAATPVCDINVLGRSTKFYAFLSLLNKKKLQYYRFFNCNPVTLLKVI